MVAYAVILFAASVVFVLVSIRIYQGKTELIHSYHQTGVKDKAAYGKAFGKALGVMAGAMAISGAVALFGEAVMWIAVAVLLIGLVIGLIAIIWVQKKFNGGVL